MAVTEDVGRAVFADWSFDLDDKDFRRGNRKPPCEKVTGQRLQVTIGEKWSRRKLCGPRGEILRIGEELSFHAAAIPQVGLLPARPPWGLLHA